MIIRYIGHACFKISGGEAGCSVVLDPYENGSVPGFKDIDESAGEVLCSHDHFDHNCRDAVRLEDQGECPFEIRFIESWHDDVKGAKRGPNRITVIIEKSSGKKLIHYGDIGEVLGDLLTDENRELLCGADVALIPVGGTYTYDADEALDLIGATEPKLTIPMHYRSEAGGYGLPNIGSIEDFLDKAAKRSCSIQRSQDSCCDTGSEMPEGILTLEPCAV